MDQKKRGKDRYLLIARLSSRQNEIHWNTYSGASDANFFSGKKKVYFKKIISANSLKVFWILSLGILPLQAFMAPLN